MIYINNNKKLFFIRICKSTSLVDYSLSIPYRSIVKKIDLELFLDNRVISVTTTDKLKL